KLPPLPEPRLVRKNDIGPVGGCAIAKPVPTMVTTATIVATFVRLRIGVSPAFRRYPLLDGSRIGLSAAEHLGIMAIGAGLIPITPTAAFPSPFLSSLRI